MNSDSRNDDAGFAGIADAVCDGGGSVRGVRERKSLRPRRIARKFQSFLDRALPGRKLKSIAAAIIMAVAGSGYFLTQQPQVLSGFASNIGFAAKSLIIKGNEAVDTRGVEYALASQMQSSIFSFDTNAAREVLLKNPWLKSANVQRIYPGTVVVDLVEREPFAFWKASDQVTVIARDGVVLGRASPEHMKLPQVVGVGANLSASEFVSTVSKFPKIVERASAFVRVADRRWDIVTRDGKKVLLPEFDWKEALADLEALQKNRGILDRQLVHIDLRLPDRMVLRLDPETAKARSEHLENLLKRDWHRT